jgi:hypothetical protein
MKRLTTVLVAAALLAPAAANAQDLIFRRACVGSHYRYCTTTVTRAGDTGIAKIVQVPEDSQAEPATPEQAYVFAQTCRPKIVVDNLGVSRYVYAHKGCDTGQIPNGVQR